MRSSFDELKNVAKNPRNLISNNQNDNLKQQALLEIKYQNGHDKKKKRMQLKQKLLKLKNKWSQSSVPLNKNILKPTPFNQTKNAGRQKRFDSKPNNPKISFLKNILAKPKVKSETRNKFQSFMHKTTKKSDLKKYMSICSATRDNVNCKGKRPICQSL